MSRTFISNYHIYYCRIYVKKSINKFYWGKLAYYSIGLIILLGMISFYISKYYSNKVNSFSQWNNKINYDKYGKPLPYSSTIFTGIFIGIIIGFIDNLALFYGIQTFENKFKSIILSWGIRDEKNLVTGIAGLGNTFSNAIKIFLGTYSHKIITDYFSMYHFCYGLIVLVLL